MATAHSTPKIANPHGPVAAIPMPQPKTAASANRQLKPILLIAGGAIAVLALAIGAWLFFRPAKRDVPLLNADTDVIVKFACTKKYETLTWNDQQQYMKVLDKAGPEMLEAYRQKKISSEEYRTGLGEAWLGKHLLRVQKYHETVGIREKTEFLAKVYEDKHSDPEDSKQPKTPKGPITGPNGEILPDVKRNTTAEQLRVNTFPPEVREQWKKFDKSYKAYKKEREAAEEAALLKARAAATRPATAPVNTIK